MGMCTNKQINDRMHDERKGLQNNHKDTQKIVRDRCLRANKAGNVSQSKKRDLDAAFAYSLGFYNG